MCDLLQLQSWQQIPGLLHGFTGRAGGLSQAYGKDECNLGFTPDDDPAAVRANRAALLAELGGTELAMVRQIHSATVLRAGPGFGQGLAEADGIITNEPGLLLAVQAADCVPVLVADPIRRTAGAFHAGWRGTAAGIIRTGIAAMQADFASRPEDLLVAIGPSIGPCCYAVGGDLQPHFAPDLFTDRNGNTFLDLWEANRRQALEMGVPPTQITLAAQCTACTLRPDQSRRYFSHRADAARTGRGAGIIGWKPLPA